MERLTTELKALFLKCRNNSDELYMYLIERIYKMDIIVAKREGVFAKAGKIFNDCRDKFNKSVKTLVNKYKERYQDRLADKLMFIYFRHISTAVDANVTTHYAFQGGRSASRDIY